jgi:hypothetical protein
LSFRRQFINFFDPYLKPVHWLFPPPPQFLFLIIGVLMASTTAFITASDLGYIVGNVPAGAVMLCAITSLCYALFRAFLARDYE